MNGVLFNHCALRLRRNTRWQKWCYVHILVLYGLFQFKSQCLSLNSAVAKGVLLKPIEKTFGIVTYSLTATAMHRCVFRSHEFTINLSNYVMEVLTNNLKSLATIALFFIASIVIITYVTTTNLELNTSSRSQDWNYRYFKQDKAGKISLVKQNQTIDMKKSADHIQWLANRTQVYQERNKMVKAACDKYTPQLDTRNLVSNLLRELPPNVCNIK